MKILSKESQSSIYNEYKHWEGMTLKRAYKWGNPTLNNEYGNYPHILNDYLLPHTKNHVMLDLGCGSGKWTRYMMDAKEVYCVDLRYYDALNCLDIMFALCNGYNLDRIKSKSIDFVFSMDVLCRQSKEVIENYAKEIDRVLKPNGKMCIHLPCNTKQMSVGFGFTPVTIEDINSWFDDISIDTDTINHGVLVMRNIDV